MFYISRIFLFFDDSDPLILTKIEFPDDVYTKHRFTKPCPTILMKLPIAMS